MLYLRCTWIGHEHASDRAKAKIICVAYLTTASPQPTVILIQIEHLHKHLIVTMSFENGLVSLQ